MNPRRRLYVIVGDTQQKLLSQLLESKAGLTVDELAAAVDITRSAVKQHLSGLERSGYVQHTSSKSGGRPRFLYTLTEAGIELFPRGDSGFPRVMFRSLRKKSRGAESRTLMLTLWR